MFDNSSQNNQLDNYKHMLIRRHLIDKCRHLNKDYSYIDLNLKKKISLLIIILRHYLLNIITHF